MQPTTGGICTSTPCCLAPPTHRLHSQSLTSFCRVGQTHSDSDYKQQQWKLRWIQALWKQEMWEKLAAPTSSSWAIFPCFKPLFPNSSLSWDIIFMAAQTIVGAWSWCAAGGPGASPPPSLPPPGLFVPGGLLELRGFLLGLGACVDLSGWWLYLGLQTVRRSRSHRLLDHIKTLQLWCMAHTTIPMSLRGYRGEASQWHESELQLQSVI